jgi:hypothetical protein
MEAVIHIARVIPTQNAVAFAVSEAVFNQNFFVDRGKLIELIRSKLAVKLVKGPGNGAFGNKAGGNQAIADFIVDKAQFCVGMNHEKILSIFCGKIWLAGREIISCDCLEQ